MKLIVGLGNPGLCYKHTRHNAGFWVVEKVLRTFKTPFSKRKFNARWAQGEHNRKPFILMKPLTFMNLSGQPVSNFVNYFKIPLENILIIFDDVGLQLGTIRLRPSGGAGGHNGMRSIIQSLGTDDFARLRFGIQTQTKYNDLAKYVLSSFKDKSQAQIRDETVDLAEEAVLCWFDKGLTYAMNGYNVKRRKGSDHQNYEAVFILRANLDKDAQEKLVEEIKGTIEKNKGEATQVQTWGKRKLTFLIKKQSEGTYYLVLFKLSPDMVKKVENVFKLNDSILRVLIIKKKP